MSIRVNDVIKYYGQQKALDGVSFEIPDGEIVGFLGPNGAGKSTMMKIITGYIPQSSGQVWVNGMDSTSQSMEIRRCIGYLPEHNPLYNHMYVKEYLHYVAGIYKLGANKGPRVREMIDLTGLGDEQNKKIKELSKGYRQRVGLAQSLIHDPQVLILDEPTTGLDPNQLEEVRNLIRVIGQNKTVMLSTHIMQEVEAMCKRVMILHQGRLVADQMSDDLSLNQHQIVEVEFQGSIDMAELRKLPWVNGIKQMGNCRYKIHGQGQDDIRALVFQYALENKLVLLELQPQHRSLEHLFRQLTVE